MRATFAAAEAHNETAGQWGVTRRLMAACLRNKDLTTLKVRLPTWGKTFFCVTQKKKKKKLSYTPQDSNAGPRHLHHDTGMFTLAAGWKGS